jgi:hypothetical protein
METTYPVQDQLDVPVERKTNAELLVEKMDNFLVWQKDIVIRQMQKSAEGRELTQIEKQACEEMLKIFEGARTHVSGNAPTQVFNMVQLSMAHAPDNLLDLWLEPKMDPLERFHKTREITAGVPREGILASAPNFEDFDLDEDRIKLAKYLHFFAVITNPRGE